MVFGRTNQSEDESLVPIVDTWENHGRENLRVCPRDVRSRIEKLERLHMRIMRLHNSLVRGTRVRGVGDGRAVPTPPIQQDAIEIRAARFQREGFWQRFVGGSRAQFCAHAQRVVTVGSRIRSTRRRGQNKNYEKTHMHSFLRVKTRVVGVV